MKMNRVGDYLDSLFPQPKCELDYDCDYELLIAIVLSAQTTDKKVNQVTSILFEKYSSLKELKEASLKDLEDILRPLGSFRKKAAYIRSIASILEDQYHGHVPTDRVALQALPGVGRKTCNVFLSEFYHEAAFGVDTHVERVSKRLKIAPSQATVLQVENKLMKYFPEEEWARRHLQLVLFGRYYCKAVRPGCKDCKLFDICVEKNKNIRS